MSNLAKFSSLSAFSGSLLYRLYNPLQYASPAIFDLYVFYSAFSIYFYTSYIFPARRRSSIKFANMLKLSGDLSKSSMYVDIAPSAWSYINIKFANIYVASSFAGSNFRILLQKLKH